MNALKDTPFTTTFFADLYGPGDGGFGVVGAKREAREKTKSRFTVRLTVRSAPKCTDSAHEKYYGRKAMTPIHCNICEFAKRKEKQKRAGNQL